MSPLKSEQFDLEVMSHLLFGQVFLWSWWTGGKSDSRAAGRGGREQRIICLGCFGILFVWSLKKLFQVRKSSMARLLCDNSGVSQMQPLAFQTPSGVNQVCLFVSLFLLIILATWLTLIPLCRILGAFLGEQFLAPTWPQWLPTIFKIRRTFAFYLTLCRSLWDLHDIKMGKLLNVETAEKNCNQELSLNSTSTLIALFDFRTSKTFLLWRVWLQNKWKRLSQEP